MNILLLCEGDGESWSSWSGITRSLVDHLRLAGHTVEVGNVDVRQGDRWMAAAATFSPRRDRWGTRYHLGSVPFRLRSRRARRIVEQRGAQADVVLQIGATFDATGSAASLPCCLCCDSNILMAGRGVDSGYSDASKLTSREVSAVAEREAAVYRNAAALFPLSERLRRSFVEDFGVRPDRVRAIYAGPNLDPSGLPAETPLRAPDRPPTILFVGLQFYRKGGDLLLESFRRIRRHLPRARLLLAGVPADFVREEGVTCLGVLDRNRPADAARLASAYASADAFAMPTRFEPFGIAFVEAMHFGLPCVGPRAWAVPEIIGDGETGYTIPPEDEDALTDRLLRLLAAPSLARQMGAEGRRKATRLFTWPRVVDRMSAVLLDVVSSSRRVVEPLSWARSSAFTASRPAN
jgi:glycosyltransferase involved in cell wall biosynthesis